MLPRTGVRALLAVAATLCFARPASAATKTVQVGPNDSLTFRDMDSGTTTTTITVGDTVEWDWVSGFHSTTGSTAPETWDSTPVLAPHTFSHQFLNPGTYPYICTVHVSLGMTGTVVVLPSTTTTIITAARCGDVNGDGVVNIGDALVVAQFEVGLRQCKVARFVHPEVCDVNRDGACNIGDALRMAQCDVGLISCAFSCTPFMCQ